MGHSKYSVLGLMVLLGVYKNVLIALKSDVKLCLGQRRCFLFVILIYPSLY